MSEALKRREFLRRVGGGAAALGLGGLSVEAKAAPDRVGEAAQGTLTIKDLPCRKLGRTGVQVPPLSIGLAAMGHAFFTPEQFEPVVNAAIDAGLTYLDVAPIYDVAEERLGPVLSKRRKEVFLVSKVYVSTRDEVLKVIDQTLRRTQGERLDVCHLHDVGRFETEKVLGKGGMLEGIQLAKERGLVRFIGASGHQRVERFIPILETGQIDVLMVAMNFVDRYVYDFEHRVLPTARKHNTGIVAMKVLAGAQGGWGGYRKANPGRLIGADYPYAVRYALGIPGVSTLVMGIKSLDELRQAIQTVRSYKPLDDKENSMLVRRGKALASEWGSHFGPA